MSSAIHQMLKNSGSPLTSANKEQLLQQQQFVKTAVVQNNQVLLNSIEIIENKLYWYCNRYPPKNVSDSFFFNIDDILIYNGYNKDFGPLSLAQVHRFCSELNKIMKDEKYKGVKIFHHCSPHYHKQSNACFLMGAFQVVCLKRSADQAFQLFQSIKNQLIPFRDAGEEPSDYECLVQDCLKGLEKAISLGWYNFQHFDYKEYESNHKLDNGDMNWIIPKKILAFSSPTEKKADGLPPTFFVEKFQKMKVNAIIRLNEKLYDDKVFKKAGIEVHDLEFMDGTCPDEDVIKKFIHFCDEEIKYGGGAVAVHCRAGLGRTGTLIGIYIIQKYQFEPRALIGWLRIARPGSVIGPQQFFLCEYSQKLALMKTLYPIQASMIESSFKKQKEDQNSTQQKSIKSYESTQQLQKRGASEARSFGSQQNVQKQQPVVFGGSEFANQYNIGLGKSKQGEQLMEKRKKLTNYMNMIDNMLKEKQKKQ